MEQISKLVNAQHTTYATASAEGAGVARNEATYENYDAAPPQRRNQEYAKADQP